MPPTNAVRRDRLADAAIGLLARAGARGLTHRAVDAEAGQPPGTTSRYFRTRQALMCGAAERLRTVHFADLARAPTGPVEPTAVADHLAAIVRTALTSGRVRQVAALELYLESTRRPELRAVLTEARLAQVTLMREIHWAAGIDLTDHQASMLITGVTGLIVVALTTPEAIGVHHPEDVADLVRALAATAAAAADGGRDLDRDGRHAPRTRREQNK
jgi:DNA-binding transcriptional regulator YbjK